jgi:acyl CoA:acetate/3-ketoacid CoA transferase alpha subunit
MKKLYPDAVAALDGLLRDGLLIASGDFGLCAVPKRLLVAVRGHPSAMRHVGRTAAGVSP